MTGLGALLFAIINPSSTYWSYGFVSTIVAVFGGDFVFAAGTILLPRASYLSSLLILELREMLSPIF